MPSPCFQAVARSRIARSGAYTHSHASLRLATISLSPTRHAGTLSPSPNGARRPGYPLTYGHGLRQLQGQIRGKRTKTTVDFDDLPQGRVQSTDPLPPEDDLPAYPTVVLQARRNMLKFDNCVLLTRVGGFYELYFEQAEEYGPLLNLKVAQKRTNAGPVPMVIFYSKFPTPLSTD